MLRRLLEFSALRYLTTLDKLPANPCRSLAYREACGTPVVAESIL